VQFGSELDGSEIDSNLASHDRRQVRFFFFFFFFFVRRLTAVYTGLPRRGKSKAPRDHVAKPLLPPHMLVQGDVAGLRQCSLRSVPSRDRFGVDSLGRDEPDSPAD
jgi:hypothetical protein